jgi:hypothetical protein
MSTIGKNPTLDDADSTLLRIVSDGLQKAAEEAATKHGEELLKLILPAIAGSLAGPLASGAAAMMSALIQTVFKETSATDRKLDRMLGEPFKTAARTVEEVLSEEVQNDAEEAEATRRLQSAADRLEKAYTYAEGELQNKRLLVRVYQCLVTALLEGGGAAMRKYIAELRDLAMAAREASKRWIADADRVKNRADGVVADELELYAEISRLTVISPARRELAFPKGLPSEEQLQSSLNARETSYRDHAARLEKNAADMEILCGLMEVVHQNRREILRVSKHQKFLRRMWQRLIPGQSS